MTSRLLVMAMVYPSTKPATLGMSDCHTTPCNSDTAKHVCSCYPILVCMEKDQRIDLSKRGSSSPPDSHRSNTLVKFGSKSHALTAKSASSAGLESMPVDLFASSVPQRESLSCLCAKLNIGFLLGNLIFHRPGNNIFLRERSQAFPAGAHWPGSLFTCCLFSLAPVSVVQGSCFV